MLFCIPGCGICIPLESFLPLILVFLWNPIAKFFGFAQTTEGKKDFKIDDCCSKKDDDTPSGMKCVAGEIAKCSTKDEFMELLKNGRDKKHIVLVKFTAEWCGPCKRIHPDFVKIAERETDIIFAEVDVDENEETSTECGISAMPTFQFYKDGKMIKSIRGANIPDLNAAIASVKA